MELNEIERVVKTLERCLHLVFAKRFLISRGIRNQLADEKKLLADRYIKHYELLKVKRNELREVDFQSISCDPVPSYGGLILATLSISSEPNFMTKKGIQIYLGNVENETLLAWGNPNIREFWKDFSFEDLYADLCSYYVKGESLSNRLKYIELKLAELFQAGRISENTRPLRLEILFKEKRSNCEGYVLLLGFLFHLWQKIFPELFNAEIRFYLVPNEILNKFIKGTKFREPHMFVGVRIDDYLQIIDPTRVISNETAKRNKGFEKFLQNTRYYWKHCRVRKIEEGRS